MWCAIIFVFELYCIVCHHQCLGNTLAMHRPNMYYTNQPFTTNYVIWNAWKYFSSRSKVYLRLVYLWFQFNCLLIRRLTRLTANNLTDTQSNTWPSKHSAHCVLHNQLNTNWFSLSNFNMNCSIRYLGRGMSHASLVERRSKRVVKKVTWLEVYHLRSCVSSLAAGTDGD